jgi:hypothetical protein
VLEELEKRHPLLELNAIHEVKEKATSLLQAVAMQQAC